MTELKSPMTEALAGLHLTYCSNIHPGESWAETLENIRQHATVVKQRWRPDAPMGLGLRLSACAAEELGSMAGGLAETRAELAARGMYAFTINGFPYGEFHGTSVKEAVYRPDWRTPERVAYTCRLAEILAGLLPVGVSGSISTVPVGFRPELTRDGAVEVVLERLHECAAQLWRMRACGIADIALALEPEPMCFLETTGEGIAFIVEQVLGADSVRRFAARTGQSTSAAEDALRHHVGLCLDTCHAAVEYEDPTECVDAIARAGVRLAKVQATTGLLVDALGDVQQEALRRFADEVYLHQVVAECGLDGGGTTLVRFLDLGDALRSLACGAHRPRSWRVHFHVPIFERALGLFSNTQDFLDVALREVVMRGLCDQIEVETYTWSVLPEHYRTMSLTEMIVGELSWVARAIERARRSA